MLFNRSNLIGIVLIISSLILGGCLGKGTQKDTRFYLLQPISGISSGEHASMEGEGVMLAIGPVRVREYLSRPEIVTRTQENKIVVHDFHSWGEPLDRNFTAVLGANLFSHGEGGQISTTRLFWMLCVSRAISEEKLHL
jgi:uncharacterized lipoprotein YmbA